MSGKLIYRQHYKRNNTYKYRTDREMYMKMYVGVTDYKWFEFLKGQKAEEVNFWRPGKQIFKALNENELFLFKLHSPQNYIVGGGLFVKYSFLPTYLAWSVFGQNNGTDFLIFVEQERGDIHPVAFELIGEARKMALKVNFKVKCVIAGGAGTIENAHKLLDYGVDQVFAYEDESLEGFRADCYTDVVAECIAAQKPSSVLIGATALGRSLAPRLATRFHTGLTADCTTLDIKSNTDMVQIRPAFGGNIMAQISITKSRPQFATVRYRVMDAAQKVESTKGEVIVCSVKEEMKQSPIEILKSEVIEKTKNIEDEDVLVVAGRGVRNEKDVEMCEELAKALGGQLAFTRPMIENGFGDVAHQVGLSGRTVRPKLIITCGVSGAIQFTSCMTGSECIVAINNDPEAQIFNVAHYCIVDDLYKVVPYLTELVKQQKGDE